MSYSSIFAQLSELLKDKDNDSSDSEQEFVASKEKVNKGGEDPNFQVVIKGNPRARSAEAGPLVTEMDAEPSQLVDEDPEAKDERERRKMERQEARRRKAEVLDARREVQEAQSQHKNAEAAKKQAKDPKAIWSEEEVPEDSLMEESLPDTRKEPNYEILHKQKVTAEDAFLNMGFKDPSTNSCDEIVVRIELPEVTFKSIDLQVTSTKLYVTSPKHKLFMHLPFKVDPDRGSAKWDSTKSRLSVTLPTIRTDDF